jgi:tRNA threonylcarbamoyladenosine biosynthesis protein TsaE
MEPERDEPSVVLTSGAPAETEAIAQRLAARLHPGDVVALTGPLGAGKTCFVRGLAAGLGLDPREVSSPTFVIWHEYAGAPIGRGAAGATVLAHLDGYRVGAPAELDEIGWDELLATRQAIVAVEWPERFGDRLPALRISVDLAVEGEELRRIRITAPIAIADRLDLLMRPARRRPCPICGRGVVASAATWPFCSSRCRLVDLGRWFDERYRTSG